MIILSLDLSDVAEDSGATTVMVTAALPAGVAALGTDTAVVVSVADRTATAVADYMAVTPFTVTILGTETSVTGSFEFTPVDDVIFEPRETVSVSGTAAGFTVLSAILGITGNDDNPPSRLLSVTLDTDPGEGTSSSVTESSGTTTVTVTAVLAEPTARPALISVSIADGTAIGGRVDYFVDSSTFTFTVPAGDDTGTGTFVLSVIDRPFVEEMSS